MATDETAGRAPTGRDERQSAGFAFGCLVLFVLIVVVLVIALLGSAPPPSPSFSPPNVLPSR